jgi:hypothetical protein
MQQQELLRSKFPDIEDFWLKLAGSNFGLIDTTKEQRMLGWKEGEAFWGTGE